jgi:hypothetical protein
MDADNGGVAAPPGHDHPSTRPAGDTTGAASARQSGQRSARHPDAYRRCPHADALPGRRYVCADCQRRRRTEARRARRPPRYCGCGSPRPLRPGRRVCAACRKAGRRRWTETQKARRRAALRRCGCGAPLARRRRICPNCQRERRREYRRQWLARPGNRAKQNAARRRWDQRHPEYRYQWAARHYADPAKRQALLESQRMAQRLLRERRGEELRPIPEERYPGANPKWRLEDPEPLRQLVREWLAAGTAETDLAGAAGVSARLIYRLLHEGSGITVASADRLLMAMGLHLDLLEGAA